MYGLNCHAHVMQGIAWGCDDGQAHGSLVKGGAALDLGLSHPHVMIGVQYRLKICSLVELKH